MKTAIIQFDTIWEDKLTNFNYVQNEVSSLSNDVDLVVLPEMFSTGFTMDPEKVAEFEDGETFQFIANLAITKQVAIAGSWVVNDNNAYFNRLFFVFPDGSYKTYNKRHLFTLAGEHNVYEPGNERLIVDYKGFKICLLICYDLRFPVYSRIVNANYDVLIYVASWPERRIEAWDSLLKARAIENMSYVIGVNRCGIDPTGVIYNGHSQVIDFMGKYLIEPVSNEQSLEVLLQIDTLKSARAKFAFLNDADNFEIT